MNNEPVDDAGVMRLWRESGLPEYFLGNGGSNDKLVAFAGLLRTAKALEWRGTTDYTELGVSDAVGLRYLITKYDTGFRVDANVGARCGDYPSMEAAKTAAQCDYEARIRSTLAP